MENKKLYIAAAAVATIAFFGLVLPAVANFFPKVTVTISTQDSEEKKSESSPAQVEKISEPPTEKKKAAEVSNGTIEQRNALKKADFYAKNMYMSKAKLYFQLTSEYGENFSSETAKWAIENLSGVDWKENALAKAKQYREQQAMSVERIRQQLLSEYGEDFEPEEVDYAIANLPK